MQKKHLHDENIQYIANGFAFSILYTAKCSTENLWKDGVLVQLINANGAVEKVFNVQEPNALLDIKGVAAGMYWIKLDNGEQSSSKPIVIK